MSDQPLPQSEIILDQTEDRLRAFAPLRELVCRRPIKTTLANLLPATTRYRLLHHGSKSNLDLQIDDYCTWAIYRKWNAGDARSYQHIQPAVTSEFDIFRTGTTHYY